MLNLFIFASFTSLLMNKAAAEDTVSDTPVEETKDADKDVTVPTEPVQDEQVQTKEEAKEEAEVETPLFEQQMTLAKQQIQSNKLQAALNSLDKAEKEMSKSTTILNGDAISQVWFYRGVIEALLEQDPLESWRQALIINLGQKWDPNLLSDEASRDMFLALKTEVQNRRIVSIQHPEQYGHAKLYVDGFLRAPGDFVYQGEHLAQIECPNGEVFGKWTNFEKTFKWIKMCPYKFDVNDMPEPEAVDEWDMFGGFGGQESAPEVNMSNQMVADPLFMRMNKPTLYGSIGSAVIAGALYSVALKNSGEFADIDNTMTVTELDALRSKTNTIAIGSMTFGILSGGLYMYSMSTAKIAD